jgi:hypothetical protein
MANTAMTPKAVPIVIMSVLLGYPLVLLQCSTGHLQVDHQGPISGRVLASPSFAANCCLSFYSDAKKHLDITIIATNVASIVTWVLSHSVQH